MSASRLAFAALLVAAALPAAAKDLYVDNHAGDDRQDGTTPRSVTKGVGPCKTISRALLSADDGDRIVIANTGEPYRESITLQGGRHSRNPTQIFTIEGGGATIDGSIPVPEDGWEHVHKSVFRFEPKLKSHQELFRDGVPLERQPASAEKGLPELKPLEWCLYERHVYFCCEADRLPETYLLRHAGMPVGITLYQVEGIIIKDLIVQGFQLDGISAANGVRDTRLVGVTARGNGRSGVNVAGSSKVILEACLLGNNRMEQLRMADWSTTEVLNTNIYANTAPAWRMLDKSRLLLNGEPVELAVGDKDILSGKAEE